MNNTMASGLVIKKSNIRIWIHQRNLGHLQRVVWEGQGNQLLVEHSNNAKVRRFIEAVPHIMVSFVSQQFLNNVISFICQVYLFPHKTPTYRLNSFQGLIKDIHCDVQNDDLESLKAHVSPPVPPVVLSAKDANGLTPLHKVSLLLPCNWILIYFFFQGRWFRALGNCRFHCAKVSKLHCGCRLQWKNTTALCCIAEGRWADV